MQETQETRVWSLGQKDPQATHASILAWIIPWQRSLRASVHGVSKSWRDWAHSHTNLASALRFLSISPSVGPFLPTFRRSSKGSLAAPQPSSKVASVLRTGARLLWMGKYFNGSPTGMVWVRVIHQHTVIKSIHIWSEWNAANGKTQKQDFYFFSHMPYS